METNSCINCSNAIQCPDGRLRCDIDFTLAINTCSNFAYGRFKIFIPSPEYKNKISKTIKKVKPVIAGKKQRKKTVSPNQRSLF